MGQHVTDLKFQVLKHIPMPCRGGDRINLLKQHESHWIHTLDTLVPKVSNRECDFFIIL